MLFSKINLAGSNYFYSVGVVVLYYELDLEYYISRAVLPYIVLLVGYPPTGSQRIKGIEMFTYAMCIWGTGFKLALL